MRVLLEGVQDDMAGVSDVQGRLLDGGGQGAVVFKNLTRVQHLLIIEICPQQTIRATSPHRLPKQIKPNKTSIVIQIANSVILLLLIEDIRMSRKIKNDQYELIVQFKSNNSLSITAEFLPTGQIFSNQSVQLMRISKDTVIAALDRKAEKNIRSQFQQHHSDGQNILKIVFVVNFDFLPEFREEIELGQVEVKVGSGVGLATMQVEVEELKKNLDFIEANGATFAQELGSSTMNQAKKQLFIRKVEQGKYIFRISGLTNNTAGAGLPDKFSLFVEYPGQAEPLEAKFRTHYQGSYQYPFSYSTLLSCDDGEIKLYSTSEIPNGLYYNLHFVINRVLQVN